MTPRKKAQRFQVELKSNAYYVIDTRSGMTMGGPFNDYLFAMRQANQLEQSMGAVR